MDARRELYPGDNLALEQIKASESLAQLINSPCGVHDVDHRLVSELIELIWKMHDELYSEMLQAKTELESARLRGQLEFAQNLLTKIEGQFSHAKRLRKQREEIAEYYKRQESDRQFREERSHRVSGKAFTRDGI